MSIFTRMAVTTALLSSVATANAATFCVSTSAQLQEAIEAAETNGQLDEIRVLPGLYVGVPQVSGEAVFDYLSDEVIRIHGVQGTSGNCSSTPTLASNVILSGSGQHPVLSVRLTGGNLGSLVTDLRIVNGRDALNRAAGLSGRVLASASGARFSAHRVILEDHVATQAGGASAFSLIAETGEVTLMNSVVRNNQSTQSQVGRIGGNTGTEAYLVNVTIVGNRTAIASAAAAIPIVNVAGNGTAYLTNNLFWDNLTSANLVPRDFALSSLAAVFMVHNHFTAFEGTAPINSNQSSGDPLFVSATNLRLKANSPARNSGNSLGFGVATAVRELDLGERVQGGQIDRGAYEFSELFADGFE